jgi:hypothetical protein
VKENQAALRQLNLSLAKPRAESVRVENGKGDVGLGLSEFESACSSQSLSKESFERGRASRYVGISWLVCVSFSGCGLGKREHLVVFARQPKSLEARTHFS